MHADGSPQDSKPKSRPWTLLTSLHELSVFKDLKEDNPDCESLKIPHCCHSISSTILSVMSMARISQLHTLPSSEILQARIVNKRLLLLSRCTTANAERCPALDPSVNNMTVFGSLKDENCSALREMVVCLRACSTCHGNAGVGLLWMSGSNFIPTVVIQINAC